MANKVGATFPIASKILWKINCVNRTLLLSIEMKNKQQTIQNKTYNQIRQYCFFLSFSTDFYIHFSTCFLQYLLRPRAHQTNYTQKKKLDYEKKNKNIYVFILHTQIKLHTIKM